MRGAAQTAPPAVPHTGRRRSALTEAAGRVDRCCQTRGRGLAGAWPQLWGGELASLLAGRPGCSLSQNPRGLRGYGSEQSTAPPALTEPVSHAGGTGDGQMSKARRQEDRNN